MGKNDQAKPEAQPEKPSSPDAPNPRLLQTIRETENDVPHRLHNLMRGIERPDTISKEDSE